MEQYQYEDEHYHGSIFLVIFLKLEMQDYWKYTSILGKQFKIDETYFAYLMHNIT